MFRYLTGTLEREEQKTWKILAIADFISPVADLFNFSVIIYIINIVQHFRWEQLWLKAGMTNYWRNLEKQLQ